MSELRFLHRGSFRPLPGAEAMKVGPNVWQVRVPRSDAVQRLLRRSVTADLFDDSVWTIDEVESVQALGSGEQADHVVVTVLLP